MDKAQLFVLAGRAYAPNAAALVRSLFAPGGTMHGTYKVAKRGVSLFAPDGTLRAFVVDNAHGEQFMVSARKEHGRIRYMCALTGADQDWLGVPEGYAAERAAVAVALRNFKLASAPGIC